MESIEKIKKLIELKSISPYLISKNTGVSEATLSRILSGKTKKPNASTIASILSFLEGSGSTEHKTIDSLDSFTPNKILEYIIDNKDKFRDEPKAEAVALLLGNMHVHTIIKNSYDKADEVDKLIEELKKKNGL